jgi:hypothetical protein
MNCRFFPAGEHLEVAADADTVGETPAAQAARATLTEMTTTGNEDALIRELLRARTE